MPKVVQRYAVDLCDFMHSARYIILFFCLSPMFLAQGQDIIERTYFPGAQARNAAIAAARYAEEGYHYTRFTTYISAVDSSRIYADTALFFVKRSLMLCDTSLHHAPLDNKPALDYLHSGRTRATAADSVLRGFYPMMDIKSHRFFGKEAMYHLSNTVMDFFSASLMLKPEDASNETNVEQYDVLPFEDEILRLEADEAAFQHLVNQYDLEVKMLEGLSTDIQREIGNAVDQKTRAHLRSWLDELNVQMVVSHDNMEGASFRIQELRLLLDKKYLSDLANTEGAEHLSQFETNASKSNTVAMDEDLPDGLVYKIQLGYYPADVDINNFRGLFPISGETVKQGTSRIFAGLFFNYADASAGLDFVRNNAIANAFIVPFNNGAKISMSRAVELEKARGVR